MDNLVESVVGEVAPDQGNDLGVGCRLLPQTYSPRCCIKLIQDGSTSRPELKYVKLNFTILMVEFRIVHLIDIFYSDHHVSLDTGTGTGILFLADTCYMFEC